MKIKVCHLTSVHTRNDVRIYYKEIKSLIKVDYELYFVVSDGKGYEEREGLKIFDVGLSSETARFERIFKMSKKVVEFAVKLDCDVYHFHDPEILIYLYKFKNKSKKIIYDSHEDLPEQFKSKTYLNPFVRLLFPKVIKWIENFYLKNVDLIITATESIKKRFDNYHNNVLVVTNYAMIDEFTTIKKTTYNSKKICFIGGITEIRGISHIMESLKNINDIKLLLAGEIYPTAYYDELKKHETWTKVEYYGILNRDELKNVLLKSDVGLVIYEPLPNHLNAVPNKIFEYMSAGLPIIASNFPLWEDFVKANDCGICVNPIDPKSISNAIVKLVNNPDLCEKYGANGRKTFLDKYNWNISEKLLLDAYRNLLK